MVWVITSFVQLLPSILEEMRYRRPFLRKWCKSEYNERDYSPMRAVGRRLLKEESAGGKSSDDATFSALEKLRCYLSRLLGVHGFQSLLSRALVLAKAEAPALSDIHVKADGSLDRLPQVLPKEELNETEKCGEVLLAHLIKLLTSFIGETLTLRLLCDLWPDVCPNDFDFGEEKTSL